MSKELEKHLIDNSQIREVSIGAWSFKFLNKEVLFDKEVEAQAIELISQWVKVFPKEKTWVQNNLEVPTLILRLDATVNDGVLGLYEIEERPAGIGVSAMLNPGFSRKLQEMKNSWPEFDVLVSSKRKSSDDHLWSNIETGKPNGRLLLIRAEPEEEEFHSLESQSVSTLLKKGDKSYGLSLGLWKKIHSREELDFDKAFVLKPLQGSKTRDMYLWHPERLPGTVTRTKIENALISHKDGMFMQLYIDPMRIDISGEQHCMMYRVYFGLDPKEKTWKFLGGLWNSRPNVKIHGASDAVFGPVPPNY